MKYNQVYGTHSLGTGAWIDDNTFNLGKRDIYNEKIIDSYTVQVAKDLAMISIRDKIKDYKVMDVGTGRQALALKKLGAKEIDHYDISSENVKNFTEFLQKNSLEIKSLQADICDNNFNKGAKYDFIYLQGIIQHTRSPYNAIENLAKASKNNAILWFYNYQAGPMIQLYVEALRKFLPLKLLKLDKLNYQLLSLDFSLKEVDIILDDCGCTYRHLINNEIYKKALEKFGFTRYFTKDVNNQANGLDLSVKRSACISGFIKKKLENKKIIVEEKDLKHLDHFEAKNFKEDQRDFINKVKKILESIIQKINHKTQEEIVEIAYPVFKQIVNFDNTKPLKVNQIIFINIFSDILQKVNKV